MIEKARMSKCDVCNETVEHRLLYKVIDKNMCLACGNGEIDKWNKMVAECESANSDERKVSA